MGSVLTSLFRVLISYVTNTNDKPEQPQNGQYPSHQQPAPQYPVPQPSPQRPHAPYPQQTPAPYPQQAPAPYPQQTPAPYPQQTPAPYPSQPTHQWPHKYQNRIDANQQHQHDPHYVELRARATREGDQMAHCFEESRRAYENGDGARAKQLSVEGRHHQAELERLNAQASDWIFYQNNTDSAPDEVDLHGLYVAEAIKKTEQAITNAQNLGKDHLNLIVGKGIHSQDHIAKLKPALENLVRKSKLAAHLDPHNEGVLVVSLRGSDRGKQGVDFGYP